MSTSFYIYLLAFFVVSCNEEAANLNLQTTNESYPLIITQELQGSLEEGLKLNHSGKEIGELSRIFLSSNQNLIIAELAVNKDELIPVNSSFHLEFNQDYTSRFIVVDYSKELDFLKAYDTINIENRTTLEYEISKLTENLNKDSLMQDSANLEHLSRAKDKFDSLIHN